MELELFGNLQKSKDEKMTRKIEISTSSCQYEMYDPESLMPLNESTTVRLIEVGWDASTFADKTVLDIGCNSGALSVYAVQNGATSVISVDVQDQLIEFFSAVVKKHNLPISVQKASLDELDAANYKSDIVLCMEVLHWVVHQGGTIGDAVAKLSALTREVIYLETPWDTNEPSIKNKADYPIHEYDIEKILLELSRHFESVKILKFMTYFGDMKDSKRVLIEAKNPIVASLGARHISDGNLSKISLSRGMNESLVVTTRKGVKVLKCLPHHSTFHKLPSHDAEALGAFVSNLKANNCIAKPEPLDGRFVRKEADGKTYMMFPFVGPLANYFPKKRHLPQAKSFLGPVVELSMELAKAPAQLVAAVRSVSPKVPPSDMSKLDDDFRHELSQRSRRDFIIRMNEILTNTDRSAEDCIIHNDLQSGNFVVDAKGNEIIVDFDLIRSGPVFADLLSCALYNNLDLQVIDDNYRRLSKCINRNAQHFDVAFATISCLNWLNFRSAIGVPTNEEEQTVFFEGLDKIICFYDQTF